ncbi:hypothetical protein CYCD_11110 [Tenuifilaceae bacterium CYCD]|nr:hypothetical protein CYCD_11110 [Tenuifilaceae bacterium CYCD]
MLLSFFRKSQILAIFAIVIVLAAIWIKTFFNGITYPFIFDSINMPLYSIVAKYLKPELLYTKLTVVAFILSIAFYLLHLNGKYIIIKQRTYIPALLFIIISSAFTPIQRVNPAVFAGLFITIALDHIFAIYQKHSPLDNLFRAGISLGIASLFYAPAITIYLLLFVSLSILRSFNAKEWFVSILGIILPWGVLLLINLWLQIGFSETVGMVSHNLITPTQSSIDELIPIVFTSAIGLPTLVAIIYMIPSMANQKISVRKFQNIFFWLLLLSVSSFVIFSTCSYEIAYIAAIPLSFQLGNYFTTAKGKFWPEVLFMLIFIAALAVQLYPIFVDFI